MRRSVQEFPPDDSRPVTHIFQFASVADEAPAWWSPARDRYLDRFWPTEPFLAGAIFSIASRNSSFRYELAGPRDQVIWAQQLLAQADFGKGWQSFMMKVTQDYLCQDNAAMFEIIRPSRARTKAGTWYDAMRMPHPETGEMTWWAYDRHNGTVGSQYELDFKVTDNPLDLPVGIAHLDSQQTVRTGNPEYPIIYTDLSGKDHKLSMYQVVTLEEMPSPRENMNDVQVCAVSRSLRLAQTLRDMLIYKQEKVSGRFARAIHLTNADADAIEDAVKQANANADNRNLMRYSQPIIAAVLDPNAKPVVETIELASLPDGFDEETAMRWYIAGLALDLGVDYGFLAPLPGNRLGTSTQAEAAERQAKGKSSRLFLNKLEYIFNFSGILPRNVTIKFAVPDPYEESERDRALARRARSISTLIQAGVITPEIARQMLLDWHDLSPDYLALLGEEDLTPTLTLSGSEVPRDPPRIKPRPQPVLDDVEEEEPE